MSRFLVERGHVRVYDERDGLFGSPPGRDLTVPGFDSPYPFEWGADAQDVRSLELARAVLREVMGLPPHRFVAAKFRADVVAGLSEEWELDVELVLDWLGDEGIVERPGDGGRRPVRPWQQRTRAA